VCTVISAEPGGAVAYTEQETDAHVGRDKDCNPAQLQDGRRSLGTGSACKIVIIAVVVLYYYYHEDTSFYSNWPRD